jgi:transposase
MPEGYLTTSADERERSHLISRSLEKTLSQLEAAERAGIGTRQFKRLVRTWKQHGDAGLFSRRRGRAPHNRLTEAARLRIERLLRESYPDFGPTLAAEKLAELDNHLKRSTWSTLFGRQGINL